MLDKNLTIWTFLFFYFVFLFAISIAFVIKTEKVDDGLELFVFQDYEANDTLEKSANKLRDKINRSVF